MTARTRRATRRAVIAAYIAAWVLLLWTVAATGEWWIAALTAAVHAVAVPAGIRATRPRRAPDGLLAVADAAGVTRPGRHAFDTPTSVIPQVKP